MSRCRACNVVMSEYELSTKYKETSVFVDLCCRCLSCVDIEIEADGALSDKRPNTFDQFDDPDQLSLTEASKILMCEEEHDDY